MNENLKFIEPESAYRTERRHYLDEGLGLFFAHFAWDTDEYIFHWKIKKPSPGVSTYRNVVAWYLKAAGLTGVQIGEYLSISASRANQIALKTRNKIFNYPTNRFYMERSAKGKFSDVPKELLYSHHLRAMRNEMLVAEHILWKLSDLTLTNELVISGALKIGRKSYLSAYEKASGLKCTCHFCNQAVFNAPLSPYWEV